MNRQELGRWLGLDAEQTGRLLPSQVRAMRHVPVPTTDEQQVEAFTHWLRGAGRAPAPRPQATSTGTGTATDKES